MKKLLIIFFIVLGIYFYRLSTGALNIDNTGDSVPKDTRVNSLIINQNNNSTYNLTINEPTELDFLSKQQVFDNRKKYAEMNPAIIPSNYSPSDTVFGQIEDNKPWWGLKGAIYRGPGQNSIDGLSEETRFINNPLLLMGLNEGGGRIFKRKDEPDIYVKPISIYFQPKEKNIIVTYDILGYYKDLGLLRDDNTYPEGTPQEGLFFECINARDFGYNFAYAYSSQNIIFKQPNNLSTNVQQLQDYLHTGGSCGYQGGCNNASPNQEFLNFTAPTVFPAQISIKLWKKMPYDKNAPADIYFILKMQ